MFSDDQQAASRPPTQSHSSVNPKECYAGWLLSFCQGLLVRGQVGDSLFDFANERVQPQPLSIAAQQKNCSLFANFYLQPSSDILCRHQIDKPW